MDRALRVIGLVGANAVDAHGSHVLTEAFGFVVALHGAWVIVSGVVVGCAYSAGMGGFFASR